ncbi:hypothetical protein PIB30_034355 [Stylosanthes scabra]|uniref:Uncharacterized protein n=1 Tax=Stylosanthes scabra TaxID=79078 RepID=A0ABU6VBG9_9FABA|nr:hypothetical protein [Stylosanthes scabra]
MSITSSLIPEALTFLDLGFCNLWEVPDDIGTLRGLERLNLQRNPFYSLPDTIGKLSRLAYLNLDHCFLLYSLPQLPFVNDYSSGGRYFKTISGSRNQRCGFDILFPEDVVPPGFFNNQFKGGSTIRIVDSDVDDNWIGFAFCIAFCLTTHAVVSGFQHDPLSTTLPSPLYLSFESEHAEETFCMPCHLDPVRYFSRYPTPDPRAVHVWIIYISRPHCHFLKTGANITFKASPNHIEIKNWGLRMVFKQDIEATKSDLQYLETPEMINPFYYSMNDPKIQLRDHKLVIENVHESSNSSTGPKFQLPYNWYVTEEEEQENMEAKAKEIISLILAFN